MRKSYVLSYLWCPYKFKLNVIDGLENTLEPKEGSPLKIGLDLHEIFDKYYDCPGAGANELKKPYYKNILSILKRFDDYNKYESHLKNFAHYNVYNITQYGIEYYMPVYRELTIYNQEVDLIGTIDRIDDRKFGKMIIDYKTGRPKALKHYIFELSVYKFLYEQEYDEEIKKIGIFFSQANRLDVTSAKQKDVAMALNLIELVREKIEDEVFPRKKGFHCRFCEHKVICELEEYE
jgi:CRISPR/Cas system-associated exonuclease Cas4 (RecB family)